LGCQTGIPRSFRAIVNSSEPFNIQENPKASTARLSPNNTAYGMGMLSALRTATVSAHQATDDQIPTAQAR
jgi:hypothetical protein